MRKPFVLSEYLADKSQRVETRDGDPVRIICTDAISLPIPSIRPTPIIALALHNGVEQLTAHSLDGRVMGEDSGDDLFLVTDAESEDERIRKELVAFFIEVRNREGNEGYWHDLKVADILTYLEKQKEQKPAWGEEDENALKYFHELISFGYAERFMDAQTAHDMREWVNKSLRPQPRWKPSEEQMAELNKVRTLNPGLDALYQQLKNM